MSGGGGGGGLHRVSQGSFLVHYDAVRTKVSGHKRLGGHLSEVANIGGGSNEKHKFGPPHTYSWLTQQEAGKNPWCTLKSSVGVFQSLGGLAILGMYPRF